MYNEFSDSVIGREPVYAPIRPDDPNMVYATAVYATTFAPKTPALTPIPRWSFRDVILLSISGVIVAGVFGLPTYLVVLMVSETSPNSELTALSCASTVIFGVVFVVLIGVGRLMGRTWADLGFRRPSNGWLIGGVFLSAMLLPIRILLVLLIMGLPNEAASESEPIFVLDGWFWMTFGLFLFTAIVLAPLTEELVFRAILYGWLRRLGGVIMAALVSGILFGLAHLDVRMAIANSIMGVALALVYERSRSLWVPIMMHFINNLIAGGLLLLLALVIVAVGGT